MHHERCCGSTCGLCGGVEAEARLAEVVLESLEAEGACGLRAELRGGDEEGDGRASGCSMRMCWVKSGQTSRVGSDGLCKYDLAME